ncbi:zinc-dependent alcohol dehydrogenase family protein [Paraburkholderia agricolaris]|uniref:Zinc-dependent alcohol dehydrogenase family protein n=1 Tax=Paraburkholderia agricolaris TaxID=2152888 RepID=A0ABW9A0H0_9BURK
MPVVLQIDAPGTYTDLKFRDVPCPQLKNNEVLYTVAAFGLNYGELLYMANTYYNTPSYPARTGQEAAGIVRAVGPDVIKYKIGDRVTSIVQEFPDYCVNGEFAVTPEDYLMPWPDGYTAQEACSVWSSAITAYYAFVELADVQPGDNVLITAASSTSGIGAIQMAKALGARVIATSRTLEKEAFLRAQGADDVIASNGIDVGAEIMRTTADQGVRVVFDTIAGPFVGRYAGGVGGDAKIFLVGALGGELDIVCSILPLVRTGASITGYSIYNYHRRPDMFGRAKNFIQAALETKKIIPVIDRVFEFRQSLEAYAYLKAGVQRGKIVVAVNS